MRISQKLYGNTESAASCERGTVLSSSGSSVSATGTGGTGRFFAVTPPCIDCVPRQNDDAVILHQNNEMLFLGVKRGVKEHELAPGEIIIYSANGSASILLTADGEVKIYGRVYINDEPLEVD